MNAHDAFGITADTTPEPLDIDHARKADLVEHVVEQGWATDEQADALTVAALRKGIRTMRNADDTDEDDEPALTPEERIAASTKRRPSTQGLPHKVRTPDTVRVDVRDNDTGVMVTAWYPDTQDGREHAAYALTQALPPTPKTN